MLPLPLLGAGRMRNLHRYVALATGLLLAGCAQHSVDFQTANSGGLCIASHRGVEFRTYLPDKKRYVFASVTAIQGYRPTVYVIADKNFDPDPGTKTADRVITSWWLDRSRPFLFSADKVDVRWDDDGQASEALNGAMPHGKQFEDLPTGDPNRYAFQLQFPLSGFSGDSFDVTLPAVTVDGTTVTPPPVHFTRIDSDEPPPKC
jgi:hypothetical protein